MEMSRRPPVVGRPLRARVKPRCFTLSSTSRQGCPKGQGFDGRLEATLAARISDRAASAMAHQVHTKGVPSGSAAATTLMRAVRPALDVANDPRRHRYLRKAPRSRWNRRCRVADAPLHAGDGQYPT